jgi:hypothetical protein
MISPEPLSRSDILLLIPLLAAADEVYFISDLSKVDAVPWPKVNTQLGNTLANGCVIP